MFIPSTSKSKFKQRIKILCCYSIESEQEVHPCDGWSCFNDNIISLFLRIFLKILVVLICDLRSENTSSYLTNETSSSISRPEHKRRCCSSSRLPDSQVRQERSSLYLDLKLFLRSKDQLLRLKHSWASSLDNCSHKRYGCVFNFDLFIELILFFDLE